MRWHTHAVRGVLNGYATAPTGCWAHSAEIPTSSTLFGSSPIPPFALVGSEMCIRDSYNDALGRGLDTQRLKELVEENSKTAKRRELMAPLLIALGCD